MSIQGLVGYKLVYVEEEATEIRMHFEKRDDQKISDAKCLVLRVTGKFDKDGENYEHVLETIF